MRSTIVLLLLSACASTPVLELPPSSISSPTRAPVAAIAQAPTGIPAAPDRPATAASIRLNPVAATKTAGNLLEAKLVAEMSRQSEGMSPCAQIVRADQPGVGALTLEVTVANDGSVTPDLQSPVPPEARRCILDAVRAWSIHGAGSGKALVVLLLEGG